MASNTESELINHKYATPELAVDWLAEGDLHNDVFSIQCRKHPQHEDFIPVNELNKERLPKLFADSDLIEMMKALADLTVRIRVTLISDARPSKFAETEIPYPFHIPGGGSLARAGSGFVNLTSVVESGRSIVPYRKSQLNAHTGELQICDCWECKHSLNPKSDWWEIGIITALHVLYDKKECQDAIIDFFYEDDRDKSRVVSVRGYGTPVLCGDLVSLDRAIIVCRTHSEELVRHIEDTWKHVYFNLLDKVQLKYGFKNQEETDNVTDPPRIPIFVISHPHGCRKYITVGLSAIKWIQMGCICYTAKTCPGSSGGMVCMFGGEMLYSFAPHAHALPDGRNQSGLTASGRRNPRFW